MTVLSSSNTTLHYKDHFTRACNLTINKPAPSWATNPLNLTFRILPFLPYPFLLLTSYFIWRFNIVRPSTEPSGSASESREVPGAFTEDHSNHNKNKTDSWVLPLIERRTIDYKEIWIIIQTLGYINNKCHNLELDITAICEHIVLINNCFT